MSLKGEIKDWRQDDGLVTPKNELLGQESIDSTGNGLLYASLYYIQLVKNGDARISDLIEFDAMVSRCLSIQGFLNRSESKGSSEQTGHDDYIGVCAASYLLRSKVALNLIDAGNRKWFIFFKWLYKNNDPVRRDILSLDTWRAWFGRMPWNICAMQYSTGLIKPHFLRRVFLALSILLCSMTSSSVLQAYCRLQCVGERCFMVNLASIVFNWRVDNNGGMANIIALELDRNHPIVRYWV